VQVTFNIDVLVFVIHLFNDWANYIRPQMIKALLIGASPICWTLFTSRNDIVFDNSLTKNIYTDTVSRDTLVLALGTTTEA
jgi:hypothetical protein